VAASHLDVGEKLVERGKLWSMSPFIGEGEREEATWSRTSATIGRRHAGLAGTQHGDGSLVLGC
jgi:hypothetical protein